MDCLERISSITLPAIYRSKTAEQRIMEALLDTIDEVLGNGPKRIWTLHKIEDGIIRFHNSDTRMGASEFPLTSLYNDEGAGLIGLTLKSGTNIAFYPNARELVENFREGWPDCQSELISVIRNTDDNVVGIINIESEHGNDFSNALHQEKLIHILNIATPLISVLFREHAAIKSNDKAVDFVRNYVKQKIDLNSDVSSVLHGVLIWLKVLSGFKTGFVYTNAFSENQDEFQKIEEYNNSSPFPDLIKPKEISLYNYKSPRMLEDTAVKSILGDEFFKSFKSNPNNLNFKIYLAFQETKHENHEHSPFQIIFILIMDSKISQDSTYIGSFLNIVSGFTLQFMRWEDSIVNELASSLYKDVSESLISKDMLNKACSFIADKTNSSLCIYYSVASWKEEKNGKKYFHFGASSEKIEDIEHITFQSDEGVLGRILKEEDIFYDPNLFSKESKSTHKLDHFLREFGLTNPDLFGTTVRNSQNEVIGVLLIIDDYGFNRKPIKIAKTRKIIHAAKKHFSNLVFIRSLAWNADIEKKFRQVLLDNVAESTALSSKEDFSSFFTYLGSKCFVFNQVNSPLENSAFVIYERQDGKFIPIQNQIFNNITPPNFELEEGLTGSVIARPGGELYEPNVELSKQTKNNCKEFWDTITRSAFRMFYGQHFRCCDRDYVFLIIGGRTSFFEPDQMLKSLRSLMSEYVKLFSVSAKRLNIELQLSPDASKVDQDIEAKILSMIFTRDCYNEHSGKNENAAHLEQLFKNGFISSRDDVVTSGGYTKYAAKLLDKGALTFVSEAAKLMIKQLIS